MARVFVCPILNLYGPVTDPRHGDLLNTWEEIDSSFCNYFKEDFRSLLIDSEGQGVRLSLFPTSLSGFKENPVKREMGWFPLYDHFYNTWKKDLIKYKDGFYFIYNHPDKSLVANAWGVDWLENTHYLNILNRMILERGFFPGAIEIPTAGTHSTNFVENYFPFQLSNRNASGINWDNIEADGKRTRDMLQWERAPKNWIPYHPSASDHQVSGDLKHTIFRLVDMRTRILTLPEEEIVSAFESANSGQDVVIAAYEHDFRDRVDTVKELFLKPIREVWKRYPNVKVVNSSFQEAAAKITYGEKAFSNPLEICAYSRRDYVLLQTNHPIFGKTPYVAVEDLDSGEMFHLPPCPIGFLSWGWQRSALPERAKIGIASFSETGSQTVAHFLLEKEKIEPVSLSQLPLHFKFGK